MRMCPHCREVSEQFQYSAWVVRATGTVTFGDSGVVRAVGPAVANTVVKAGKEFDSPSATLVCPKCKRTALLKEFIPVLRSYLTGKVIEGDHFVVSSVPGAGVIVSSDEVEIAERVFNRLNTISATRDHHLAIMQAVANNLSNAAAEAESLEALLRPAYDSLIAFTAVSTEEAGF